MGSLRDRSVAVVGGGFGGLSTACYLVDAEADVTVVEKNDRFGGPALVGAVYGTASPDQLLAVAVSGLLGLGLVPLLPLAGVLAVRLPPVAGLLPVLRRRGVVALLALAGYAYLIEYVGPTTGRPYGEFHYAVALGPMVAGVPTGLPVFFLLVDLVSFVVLWGAVNAYFGNWILVLLAALLSLGLVRTDRFDFAVGLRVPSGQR